MTSGLRACIQSVIVLLALCVAAQVPQPSAASQATCEVSSADPILCWRKLDAGPFSILAPSGWEFHQLMGVDSYVGEFVGDGIALTFDLGRYSGGHLKNANKPAYSVTKKSIGGRSAKVVSPLDTAAGITGVYIKLSGHRALHMGKKPERQTAKRGAENVRYDSIRRTDASKCGFASSATRETINSLAAVDDLTG